jgi:quinoprotein glucose dehydrogenase
LGIPHSRSHEADSQHDDAVKIPSHPLFLEDQLVFCTPFNEVIALHPGTGAQTCCFDARIDTEQRPADRYNCRGVAFWDDIEIAKDAICRARIFRSTNDARLIALDAKTGSPCPDFGKNGQLKIDIGVELEWPGEFQITSAPVIARGIVGVGSAIANNRRVNARSGRVRA